MDGDALATAMRQRSDVVAARLRLDAASVRLARARNSRLPSLGVTAGYASDHVENGSSLRTSDPSARNASFRVGLSLSAPMLNRRDLGTAHAAALGVDIESFRLTLTENTVLVDVRTAERRVRMGRERLAMTTRGAESAWAQLLAERRRLELGFSDAFRLLQTEENAVRTQLDAVRARYDVLRAQAQLALALGQFATTGGPRP
jgi:outer membrane protein TolC